MTKANSSTDWSPYERGFYDGSRGLTAAYYQPQPGNPQAEYSRGFEEGRRERDRLNSRPIIPALKRFMAGRWGTMGDCEGCGKPSPANFGNSNDLFDWCAECGANLCDACMAKGHCGHVVAAQIIAAHNAEVDGGEENECNGS